MVSAWSFGRQIRSKSELGNNDTPGPGNYQIKDKVYKNPIKYTIGQQQRKSQKQISNVPGAGTYQFTKQSVQANQKKYTISQKIPTKSTQNFDTLCKYSPCKPTQAPPKYTFAGKYDIDQIDNNIIVGPGKYDIQQKSIKKGKSMPKFEKIDKFNQNPGPGQYEFKDLTQNCLYKFKIGSSQREFQQQKNYNPGPGGYNIKSFVELQDGNGYTILGKKADKKEDGVPGPSTYYPQDILIKPCSDKTKFGLQAKTSDIFEGDLNPGPGEYENQIIEHKIPIKIGTGHRKNHNQMNNPGPGTYEDKHKNIKEKAPNYIMAKKYPKQEKHQNPGPGDYNPKVFKRHNSYATIGNGLRSEINKKPQNNVGPGEYTINFGFQNNSISFGNQKRILSKQSDNDLGPGQYNIKSLIADVPNYNKKQTPHMFL